MFRLAQATFKGVKINDAVKISKWLASEGEIVSAKKIMEGIIMENPTDKAVRAAYAIIATTSPEAESKNITKLKG